MKHLIIFIFSISSIISFAQNISIDDILNLENKSLHEIESFFLNHNLVLFEKDISYIYWQYGKSDTYMDDGLDSCVWGSRTFVDRIDSDYPISLNNLEFKKGINKCIAEGVNTDVKFGKNYSFDSQTAESYYTVFESKEKDNCNCEANFTKSHYWYGIELTHFNLDDILKFKTRLKNIAEFIQVNSTSKYGTPEIQYGIFKHKRGDYCWGTSIDYYDFGNKIIIEISFNTTLNEVCD